VSMAFEGTSQALSGDARFHVLLEDMRQLHVRKAQDYGDEDPLANLRAAEEFGIASWVGCCLRLNDKVRRLKSMAKKGRLVNESLEDSLLDMANYALLAIILYRETQSGTARVSEAPLAQVRPRSEARLYAPLPSGSIKSGQAWPTPEVYVTAPVPAIGSPSGTMEALGPAWPAGVYVQSLPTALTLSGIIRLEATPVSGPHINPCLGSGHWEALVTTPCAASGLS